MRFFWLIASVIVAGSLGTPASAGTVLNCKKGEDPSIVAVKACADKAFVDLDKSVSAQFDAAIASAKDPLTATLLRQENKRRVLVGDSMALISDEPQIASARTLLRKSLLRDKAVLNAIAGYVPDGPAGEWTNAFATTRITPRPGGHYHLSIDRSWVEKELDEGMKDQVSHCTLQIDLAQGADGWYAGKINADDGVPTKAIRQGASLRLVLGHEKGDIGGNFGCGFHDAVTGTYFQTEAPSAPAQSASANPVEKPSFDCKGADGAIEMEICADPELARQDRALVDAFKDALGRIDAETAKYLRADQKAWIKKRSDLYDDALSTASDKSVQQQDDFGFARKTLLDETKSRVDMLVGIEAHRPDFAGDWASMDGKVSITREKDGRLALTGGNGADFYHEGECDYTATPAIANGVLTAEPTVAPNDDGDTGRATPKVWSDGRTLVIDGDMEKKPTSGDAADDDDTSVHHPNYCSRTRKSVGRLFPVKATPGEAK